MDQLLAEQELWIDSLASIVAQKRSALEGLGVMSVNGKDYADRMRMSMTFTQAVAELANAEQALKFAIATVEEAQKRNGAHREAPEAAIRHARPAHPALETRDPSRGGLK